MDIVKSEPKSELVTEPTLRQEWEQNRPSVLVEIQEMPPIIQGAFRRVVIPTMDGICAFLEWTHKSKQNKQAVQLWAAILSVGLLWAAYTVW